MRQIHPLTSHVTGARRRHRSDRAGPAQAILAALAGAAMLVLSVPRQALAEEAQAAAETLPPQRIEAILSGQGYVGISDLRKRGAVWIADVAERDGRRYRAVVDGASGEVFGLRQMTGPRLPRPAAGPAEASAR